MIELGRRAASCTVGDVTPPTDGYISRELALQMIDEHSVSLGPIGFIGRTTTGMAPDWNPYDVPSYVTYQWEAICGYEVGVRYCIMDGTKENICPRNLYYYRNIYDRWEQEWKPDPLGLPFYVGLISWTDAQGIVQGHRVCVLKVSPNTNSFTDWIFFNYYDREIMPGNVDQMPYGAHVAVHECVGVTLAGHDWATGLAIAEWNV